MSDYWDRLGNEQLASVLAGDNGAEPAQGAAVEIRRREARAAAAAAGTPVEGKVWDHEATRRYNTVGNETATALGATEIGMEFAGDDPLAAQLQGKATAALEGLTPETYARLQRLAEVQQNAAAAQLAQGRGESVGAIRALGDMPSVVDQQAAIQQERSRRAIAAQLASQRGGYSPAAQRAAMMATGNASAAIGADAVAARATEERAARLAQVDAWNQLQAGDRANAATGDQALRTQGVFAEAGDNTRGNLLNAFGSREGEVYNRFAQNQNLAYQDAASRRNEPSTFETVVDTAAKVVGAGAQAASLVTPKPKVA